MSGKTPSWAIPDDWIEETDGYCIGFFCFPNSRDWRGIITGLFADLYYGRRWKRETGSIIEAQAIGREIFESMAMVCGEDIANALNNIASALRQSGGATGTVSVNCGETICYNTVNINPDGTDTEPPIEGEFAPGDETPPEGFSTMADYLQYKCEVANLIFDGAVTAIRTTGAISAIQAIGSVVAGYLVTATAGTVIILPPLLFAGLVAAILTVLLVGFSTLAFMNYLADEMESERAEIVCRLYSAANTTQAVDSMLDVFTSIIAAAIAAAGLSGGFASGAASFMGSFVAGLFNSDTVNQLFKLVADLSYADADCSECGTTSDCPFEFQEGTGLIKYNGETFTLSSTPGPPGFHSIIAVVDIVEECYFNYCWTFVSRSGGMNNGSDNRTREIYRYSNTSGAFGTVQYDFAHTPPGVDAFPPLGEKIPLFGFSLTDDNPFTITAKINGTVDGGDVCDE